MIKVKDLFKQEMNWVGPKCNHKSLYQREGEGDYKPKTCDRVEESERQPRNAAATRREETRTDSPQSLQSEHGPADTLI